MRRPPSSLVPLCAMVLLPQSKFICTDAYLISWVPRDDSATFESLSWALYSNDQQYVNLSTKKLPRTVFLYDCKFKSVRDWGEEQKLGHRSTMKHDRQKTKYGRVFVTIVIFVTYISNEAITKLYIKLYDVDLCVVDLHFNTGTNNSRQ